MREGGRRGKGYSQAAERARGRAATACARCLAAATHRPTRALSAPPVPHPHLSRGGGRGAAAPGSRGCRTCPHPNRRIPALLASSVSERSRCSVQQRSLGQPQRWQACIRWHSQNTGPGGRGCGASRVPDPARCARARSARVRRRCQRDWLGINWLAHVPRLSTSLVNSNKGAVCSAMEKSGSVRLPLGPILQAADPDIARRVQEADVNQGGPLGRAAWAGAVRAPRGAAQGGGRHCGRHVRAAGAARGCGHSFTHSLTQPRCCLCPPVDGELSRDEVLQVRRGGGGAHWHSAAASAARACSPLSRATVRVRHMLYTPRRFALPPRCLLASSGPARAGGAWRGAWRRWPACSSWRWPPTLG